MPKEFAITVFGATGFTGKRVLAEILGSKAEEELGPLAAAGRSADGLARVVSSTPGATGRVNVIAGVDVSNYDTVIAMAKCTRLIINCVGPFRLYGEPVVRACVEAGTHYLDICGEPEFIERMELTYGDQAAAAGVYIASACAFDSMPADFGTLIAQRAFTPPAVPSSVEMYLRLKTTNGYRIHFATWQSAVLGMGSVDSLRKLREQAKAAGKAPAPKTVGPRPRTAPAAAFSSHPAVNSWHLPFPGADASVVRRTQGALTKAGERAVHFVARFTLPSRYYTNVALAVGAALSGLSRWGWGRSLLLAAPGAFSYGLVSHEGPTEEQMHGTTAETVLIARGYSAGEPSTPEQKPDREVVIKVTTGDPGYLGTATLIGQAAITLLAEPGKLPAGGGAFTGAFLLRNTSYLDRIKARGVRVETLSDGPVFSTK